MERIVFKNSRDIALAGELYKGDSDTIIIMSHGFTGNKSELGRFDKAAEELNTIGYSVFKYDYAGCGESGDYRIHLSSHVDDLKNALALIKKLGYKNIGLLGLSTGGLVSLNIPDLEILTMVLWSPVTKSMDITKGYFSNKQLEELSQTGYLTVRREHSTRKETLVDKQMFVDRKEVNQKLLLGQIKCPVLIIHGGNDIQIPVQHSQVAIGYLNRQSKLIIVEGADHLFQNQLEEFISKSILWFKKYLPI